ncbi:hypothetical protein IJJ12_03765 [bacterium]|nr:hypothetical protein [bacterium]
MKKHRSLLNSYLASSRATLDPLSQPASAVPSSAQAKTASAMSASPQPTAKKKADFKATQSLDPVKIPRSAKQKTTDKPKLKSTVEQKKSTKKSSLTLASSTKTVKQLGSIQQILQGQIVDFTPTAPTNFNPYDAVSFYNNSDADHTDATDSDAFVASTISTTSPYANMGFLAVVVFGIGASVLGLGQLIRHANPNFAAQNDTQEAVTPPRILTFQGRLSDADQSSITQTKAMRFSLYDTSGGNTPPPVGGNILWDSNLCQVTPNSNGIFSVNLGGGRGEGSDDFNCGVSLGNVFAQHSSVWLQITVDDEVLYPRQLIKSVPYALNSETVQGYGVSDRATANTIPVVDGDGNIKLGTDNSSLINLGRLNLVSETGDIYLLPGSGNVYVGSTDKPANLFVTGDATFSAQVNLSAAQSSVNYQDTLSFRSAAGQNALTLTQDGYLGLNTTNPSQRLTVSKGSLAFEYTTAPSLDRVTLSEDVTDLNALRRIDSPTQAARFQDSNEGLSAIEAGDYTYAYTFVTDTGVETSLSPLATYTLKNSGKSILITDIAVSDHPSIVARNLYRTTKNGSQLFFLKTITDNTTTSIYDNIGDASLGTAATNTNSTGNYRYKMTYVIAGQEGSASSASTPIKVTGDGRTVKVSNLPLASSDLGVTARKLYRSLADSDKYYLVATLTDNSTTTIYDNLSDYQLAKREALTTTTGGIYAGNKLSLQFNADGSLTTNTTLTSGGRLETSHGDNQGLKLPTSIGKPFAKVGQKVGDVVYDTIGQILYIYNGTDFVPTGLGNSEPTTSASASSSNCSGLDCRLTLDVEYAGAVITGDGTNNSGTFSSGTESIGATARTNYYQWQSSQSELNDFDTTVQIRLPANFVSWKDAALTLDFATSTTNPEDNHVDLEILRSGTNINFTKTNQVSTTAAAWRSGLTDSQPLTLTSEELATLGLTANDTLTIKITTAAKDGHAVKIGQLNLNYLTDESVAATGSSLWQKVGQTLSTKGAKNVQFGGTSLDDAPVALTNLDTTSPTLLLRGNLYLDSADKQNYLDLATQSSFNIRTVGSDGTATSLFTILPNGNIGIGTATPTEALDVNGNIKANGSLQLTPQASGSIGACTADTEGKIYYDLDQGSFFACQATDANRTTFAWMTLR